MKTLKWIKAHLYIFIIIAIILILNLSVGRIGLTVGESMMPTLENSDLIFLNLNEKIDRGDVIIFNTDDSGYLIKRIIALPGETIQIKHNIIFINGKPYEDKHNVIMKDYGIAKNEITLADDEYFVMGDNRNNSRDSRSFGAIKSSDILGVVTHKLLPFEKLN